MSTNNLYKIKISPYAENHFIKSFSKTYKIARDKTLIAIKGTLQRIAILLSTTKAEKIHSPDYLHLIKCEFAVAGSNQSPHGSGNRYIVFLYEKHRSCSVLLLYAKTDVKGKNETQRR